jgi:hypothetical protein
MARITDLSGEDLQKALDVLGKADSVELKLTLLESRRASVGQALGIDALDAQIRQVFFFDTSKLDLNAAGVVVRARRRQNDTGDTVVKIRPVDPVDLADELRADPEFGVEVDAMPGGYVCSASYKGAAKNAKIREVALGGGTTRKLFSKRQRAFFSEHAPDGLELDDLQILGPIPTFRVKFKSDGYKRPMVGELWLYPDGSQVIELSTKTTPPEAFQTGMEWRAFLESKDVDISGEQQTKTKTALEFFTKGD